MYKKNIYYLLVTKNNAPIQYERENRIISHYVDDCNPIPII